MKTRYASLAKSFVALVAIVVAIGSGDSAYGMVFKSDTVTAQWDTWCYHHDGTYYLYYLVTEHTGEGFGVATSKDGVHWKDRGWAIRQSKKNTYYLGTGSVWKSPDFKKTGKFICNYSEHRKDKTGKRTQNILFAWSTDLIKWNKFGDEKMFKVDMEHYKQFGRWDCIFAIPRNEGGYWGTWTATGAKQKGTVGIGYSEDGLTWKALPPPVVAPGVHESGAFYRFGNRIHAMFGAAGRMWAYSADKVTGPYKRAEKNGLLLARAHTYFCRFFPTSDGVLVNHHSITGEKHGGRLISYDTYAAPLKLAVVDQEGILRFKYWKGNEALKGQAVKVAPRSSRGTTVMAADLDFGKGIVVEGTVQLPKGKEDKPAAVRIKADKQNYAIRVFYDGSVEMGTTDESGEDWKKQHGANRQWKFGKTASVRLLMRRGMLEVYLDDHFMECWTMGCHRAKKVTITIPAREMKVWEMTLSGWKERPRQPIDKVKTKQPLVALTFDDGPNPTNAPKLLDLFKKNNAKATFFLIGANVKKHPKLARRMLAEGHELGNHTTNHTNLGDRDAGTVRAAIESTQAIIKETVGKAPVVFRGPFLAYNEHVWTVLNDLNMPAINASQDTRDWSNASTVKSIIDKAVSKTVPGDIVLMHSWPGKTIEAMPEIIKRLQAKGYRLVTVSELLKTSEKQ